MTFLLHNSLKCVFTFSLQFMWVWNSFSHFLICWSIQRMYFLLCPSFFPRRFLNSLTLACSFKNSYNFIYSFQRLMIMTSFRSVYVPSDGDIRIQYGWGCYFFFWPLLDFTKRRRWWHGLDKGTHWPLLFIEIQFKLLVTKTWIWCWNVILISKYKLSTYYTFNLIYLLRYSYSQFI